MSVLLVSHVLISLVGIVSGFFVGYAFLAGRRHEMWTAVFLLTTIATSVTGFLFPASRVTPGHVLGVISLAALTVAVTTRNAERHVGAWSSSHVISSLVAFYLNAFVLVVQLFQKVPELKALAPTQSEPPFAIAQFVLLATFMVAGYLSLRHNRVLEVNGIQRVLNLATY